MTLGRSGQQGSKTEEPIQACVAEVTVAMVTAAQSPKTFGELTKMKLTTALMGDGCLPQRAPWGPLGVEPPLFRVHC